MSNLMLWNPSNRCQWPVSKVSSKKIDPFIPNERLKVRAKFRVCDWYTTMRSPSKNCLSRPLSCHLPKGNFEVYCALVCILWDKYKQNFEKIAWACLSWTIFGFVCLAWRKLAFRTQLFLVSHGQRNQPIIIPEWLFWSKHVTRWHSKTFFWKNWPLPSFVKVFYVDRLPCES